MIDFESAGKKSTYVKETGEKSWIYINIYFYVKNNYHIRLLHLPLKAAPVDTKNQVYTVQHDLEELGSLNFPVKAASLVAFLSALRTRKFLSACVALKALQDIAL